MGVEDVLVVVVARERVVEVGDSVSVSEPESASSQESAMGEDFDFLGVGLEVDLVETFRLARVLVSSVGC